MFRDRAGVVENDSPAPRFSARSGLRGGKTTDHIRKSEIVRHRQNKKEKYFKYARESERRVSESEKLRNKQRERARANFPLIAAAKRIRAAATTTAGPIGPTRAN